MQWHQLDHMQTVCTSLQTDNHTSTSSLNFYRPHALPDAQPKCQSTEGKLELLKYAENASVLVMDVACTVAIPLWRKRYDAVKLNATH